MKGACPGFWEGGEGGINIIITNISDFYKTKNVGILFPNNIFNLTTYLYIQNGPPNPISKWIFFNL